MYSFNILKFQRIPNVNKQEEPEIDKTSNDQLRIAWRYGQQPQTQQQKIDPNAKSFQANYFVTNKLMNKEDVFASTNVKTFELSESDIDGTNGSYYSKLAQDISSHIDSINLNINKTKEYKNILRIGI